MSEGSERRRRELHEQNRRSWNEATAVHNAHKRDQAAFLREGGNTLFDDELALAGDVSGQRVVHLQCNSGQDSLCLARLGATVTGVDISEVAVEFARGLSGDTGIAASFVRSDVLDWLDDGSNAGQFDLAFSTYGTIGWLCDLDRWARGVHRVLAPGGRLVLLEFHPLVWSLGAGGLTGDSYFQREPFDEKHGVNDYVESDLAPSGFVARDAPFQNPERAWGFQWTVAQIVQACADAGLSVETMREYPYCNGCRVFDGMVPLEGRRFGMPEGMASVPLMLGLVARRSKS